MPHWKNIALFIVISGIFTGIFYRAQTIQIEQDINQHAAQIITRVALDINALPIADPFFSYSGNPNVVASYIEKINSRLGSQAARVSLKEISISKLPEHDSTVVKPLAAAHRTIYVSFDVDTQHNKSAYILPFVLALLNSAFFGWVSTGVVRDKVRTTNTNVESKIPKRLVVDLYTKTIMLNCAKEDAVKLANKPLCFYLALVEFCEAQPDVILNQNKDVPDELMVIADKYFDRLITLGHTIRKRPNFSSSLEKTLSEIRAALDEIMAEHSELKMKYYPPKAHGEGSRSKLHSYGLSDVLLEDIEVIGK
ncbi:hypothetical protein J8L98_00595 [Pseudoalteromonas sp. MMG013]|uniref:hypothetical protein n=1 Tax=Pseudoalteromonas sp. MMG013 TaxID=2822687 RepID=UPI001B3779CF|nr:hypothetical protein [Pseudoalteromonas sp. MMG013]MBQ4860186.1 hypothetical protein [Pseudoalteromonas sp. MMG013]